MMAKPQPKFACGDEPSAAAMMSPCDQAQYTTLITTTCSITITGNPWRCFTAVTICNHSQMYIYSWPVITTRRPQHRHSTAHPAAPTRTPVRATAGHHHRAASATWLAPRKAALHRQHKRCHQPMLHLIMLRFLCSKNKRH